MIRRGTQINGETEKTANNTTKTPDKINKAVIAQYLERISIALSRWLSVKSTSFDRKSSAGIGLSDQKIVAFNHNHPPRDRNDSFLLKLIQRHRDPLPGGTNDRGDLIMSELTLDEEPILFVSAVMFCKDNKELRETLDDRARTQHLSKGGVAFTLGDQPLDDAQRKRGLSFDQFANSGGRQIEKSRVLNSVCGPNVFTAAENFRSADKMAGGPIGKCDLSAGWRGVKRTDDTLL